jgi:hypothetical protein
MGDEADAAGLHVTEQARALRAQAEAGGLRFEAYLPSDLATWILDKIARGVFTSPSEAVFVMLGEQQELEPHADLRQEALRRTLQAAMDDPRPGISAEEAMRTLREKFAAPQPEPAVWPPRRPLDRSSLTIGDTFWCGGRQWCCTDIGTRTLTAIRIDAVEVGSTDPASRRSLTHAVAEAEGWFNGPPYAVAEVVFDEHDQEGCSLEPDPDADAPTPEPS